MGKISLSDGEITINLDFKLFKAGENLWFGIIFLGAFLMTQLARCPFSELNNFVTQLSATTPTLVPSEITTLIHSQSLKSLPVDRFCNLHDFNDVA